MNNQLWVAEYEEILKYTNTIPVSLPYNSFHHNYHLYPYHIHPPLCSYVKLLKQILLDNKVLGNRVCISKM